MRCARCSSTMTEHHVDGVAVDHCEGCGAVWLDAGELSALPAAPGGLEARLRQRGDRAPLAGLACPRCAGGLRTVTHKGEAIDLCPSCAGVSLSPALARRLAGAPPRARALDLAEAGLDLAAELLPTPSLDGAALLRAARDLRLDSSLDGAALLPHAPPSPPEALDGATLLDAPLDAPALGLDGADLLGGVAEPDALGLVTDVAQAGLELLGGVVSGALELLAGALD